ncbi:MAG: HD domain-containing protein [Bacilli bacterium]|nr:HD domain-containing protein [Bacilli bacterium]
MNDIINKTIEYVKEFFKDEYSGHDFYHTLRVYNNAVLIAKGENCDLEIVSLAALLHDVDDYKIVGEQDDLLHNAKTYLKSVDYPTERIEKICHIITQISFKVSETQTPDTIEGKVVQDADRLDAIGAIGIARAFAFGGNHNTPIHDPEIKVRENMSVEEYKKKDGTTINHFYEKLLLIKDLMNTETGKKIAEHRHYYMKEFLKEFYSEWDGNK